MSNQCNQDRAHQPSIQPGMKQMKYLIVSWLVFMAALLIGAQSESDPEDSTVTLHVIGRVKKAAGKTEIVLKKKYEPGLRGLADFSHAYVLYWFDRNDSPEKRSILEVHPRGNRLNSLTGVFATRSPSRPNVIALSLCEIVGVRGNVVEVRDIDALPDSPVLDLKPYLREPKLQSWRVPDWAK